ncbi:MAG TPA: cysteine hydrolase family protein [Chloroflexia bacterium]|nr:cysteine hydrolase family protein [Chloroflexia bacterium]
MTFEGSEGGGAIAEGTALIVIDVQKGLDEPYWGERNNPEAEQNMARLLQAWRQQRWPVYHVQHRSKNPRSPLRPDYPGNEIKDIVKPEPGEPVLQKRENSAFIGTDLEAMLRSANQRTLVLTGLTTDHCISSTARMAANLGFETIVVSDATAAFDRRSPISGKHYTGEEIHDVELTALSGEFATIFDTESLLAILGNKTGTEGKAEVQAAS